MVVVTLLRLNCMAIELSQSRVSLSSKLLAQEKEKEAYNECNEY